MQQCPSPSLVRAKAFRPQRGRTAAVLIASDPGRPIYERMGFVALHRWTLWGWATV
jgi:hypothetical protein